MAIVYRHIRKDKNEPFYIGITNTDIKRPYTKYKRNNLWKNIVNKTDYEVDILFDDLTWEQAQEKEKEFIKLYGRIDLGTGTLVNMTDGGEGSPGVIPWNKGLTKENNEIIKQSSIYLKSLNRTLSQEQKDVISKKNKGKTSWNKGLKGVIKSWNTGLKGYKINRIKKGIQKIVKCPHCNLEGGTGNLKRYHFDNCKNKK